MHCNQVDVEGGGEVGGEVDALVDHRQARLAGHVRRQYDVVGAVIGG